MFENLKTLSLNEGQEAAAAAFFEFLVSDEREMILSGAGGTGKTFLMGHMVDIVLPQYLNVCKLMGKKADLNEVHMTATTNKAAEVLGNATGRPTSTIHSFLNLKLEQDFSTGRSHLTRSKSWKIHRDKIIFIDEGSMVNAELRRHINEATIDCKIVYVGDDCQLAAVGESTPNVFTHGFRQANITQQMRNCGNPALMALCQQLRDQVKTKTFSPIEIVPGSVDLLNSTEMQYMIDKTFTDSEANSRILAFTNERVNEYNGYIRGLRNLPPEFTVGEHLVCNRTYQHSPTTSLSTESEVLIIDMSDTVETVVVDEDHPDVLMEIRYATLQDQFGNTLSWVPIVQDNSHRARLLAYFKGQKMWRKFYALQDGFPDLRQRDASTVHKSQGSTYDSAFIDLTDISKCPNPVMAARMLYVAHSRARHNVYLFGDLANRFGGLKLP